MPPKIYRLWAVQAARTTGMEAQPVAAATEVVGTGAVTN